MNREMMRAKICIIFGLLMVCFLFVSVYMATGQTINKYDFILGKGTPKMVEMYGKTIQVAHNALHKSELLNDYFDLLVGSESDVKTQFLESDIVEHELKEFIKLNSGSFYKFFKGYTAWFVISQILKPQGEFPSEGDFGMSIKFMREDKDPQFKRDSVEGVFAGNLRMYTLYKHIVHDTGLVGFMYPVINESLELIIK